MVPNGCVRTRAGSVIKRTANLPALDALTAHLWFKPLVNERTWQTLFIIHDNGGGYRMFRLFNNSGTPYFQVVANAHQIVNFDLTAYIGQWLYGAMTSVGDGIGHVLGYLYDASGTQLAYAWNTVSVGSFTPTAMQIGAFDLYPDEWFNGYHAAPRIWDAVLSQTQIEDEQFSREWVTQTAQNCGYNDDPCVPSGVQDRPWQTSNIRLVKPARKMTHHTCNASTEKLYRTTALPAYNSFTILARFYREGTGDPSTETLFAFHDNGTANHELNLHILTGTPAFRIYADAGGATPTDASPTITLADWTDVWFDAALVGDATGITAYVFYPDGRLLDTLTLTWAAIGTPTLTQISVFNNMDTTLDWFNGRGQGVKLFDAALDLEDIRTELAQEQVYRKDVINTTAFQGNSDYLSGNNRTWSRTTTTGELYAPTMGDGPPIGSVWAPEDNTTHHYVGRTTNLLTPTSMAACWWAFCDSRAFLQSLANVLSFGDTGDTIGCNAGMDQSLRTWRLGNEQGNLAAESQLIGNEEVGNWFFYGVNGDGTGNEALELFVWRYDGRFLCRVYRPIPSSYTMASLRFFSFMNDSEGPYPWGGNVAHARLFTQPLTRAQFEVEMASPEVYHDSWINSAFSGHNPNCPDDSTNGRDFTVSGSVVGHWDEPDLAALSHLLPPAWSPGNVARHVMVAT